MAYNKKELIVEYYDDKVLEETKTIPITLEDFKEMLSIVEEL